MKIKEMRELTVDELQAQVAESRKALFEAKLKHSMQQLENTALLKQLKHRVAQLNTVIREKQSA